jgi:hypothetical protein
MKIIGLLLLWLATTAAVAQTNQGWPVCRNPVRVFGPRTTVDLTPLFQWWARQPVHSNSLAYAVAKIDLSTNEAANTNVPPVEDRPLAAWHRVTGTHRANVGNSWVVDATIYTSPTARTNARIVLNHPPVVEEQDYYALQAQLAQVMQQITNDAQIHETNVKAEEKDRQNEDAYRRWWASAQYYARAAAQKQQAADLAFSEEQQLQTMRHQIEQQLKTIPAINGQYAVDWFAVMLGRSKLGVPVYDLGLVSPNPP